MSGASYAGTVFQLTVTMSAADSIAPTTAATRCHSPSTVRTPTMTWRKAITSPEPTGCWSANCRSGSATSQGCSVFSHFTMEPRLPPSK